jgi:hypothetical protein
MPKEEDPSTADQIVAGYQAAAESGSTDFVVQLLHVRKQSQRALEAKRWNIAMDPGDICRT